MPFSVKDLMEEYGLTRSQATRLARRLPGSKKEQLRPGAIPSWTIPDESVESITPELLDEVRQAAPQAAPAPPRLEGDPGLTEELRAVKKEELEAARIRAKAERLKAEEELERVERRARGEGREGRSDPMVADLLLAKFEAAMAAQQQRPETSTIADVLKVLAARPDHTEKIFQVLLERLAAPAAASQPILGPTELLTLIERFKNLAGSPQVNLRQEVREAFRDGIELGRERGMVESGESEGSLAEGIVKGFAPFIPEILETVRGFAGHRGVPVNTPRGLQPRGAPSATQQEEGTMPKTEHDHQFREIINAVVSELEKPTPDVGGVGAFLETVPVNAEGTTMIELLAPLARAPESLAKLRLRMMDERLASEQLWPAVKDLLTWAEKQLEGERE